MAKWCNEWIRTPADERAVAEGCTFDLAAAERVSESQGAAADRVSKSRISVTVGLCFCGGLSEYGCSGGRRWNLGSGVRDVRES